MTIPNDLGSGVMRAMTSGELAEEEIQQAATLQLFLKGYIEYPTAGNFDLVVGHMRDYQTAWMNGRKR